VGGGAHDGGMTTELGTRVRQWRVARGLRRVETARAADVTSSWLSRVERGHLLRPDPEALERLARTLGTSVHEIRTGQAILAAAPPPPDAAAANRARVLDLVEEVFNHGNLAAAATAVASDFTLRGPVGEGVRSVGQMRAFVQRLRRALPDFRVVVLETVAAGETVTLRWTATGTHTGRVGEELPTGAVLRLGGLALVRLGDSRVREAHLAWEVTDRVLLRRILGADETGRP
jgi:transcriptional regulator with XRE-family HTH domain